VSLRTDGATAGRTLVPPSEGQPLVRCDHRERLFAIEPRRYGRAVIRIRALSLVTILVGLLAVVVGPVAAAVPDPAADPMHVALATLQPRTSAATRDVGRVYRDGCHVGHTVTTPTHCTYGRRDGTKVVVVVGDSIIAQWWAAIDGAARRAGWRVIWMSKSACPAADVTVRSAGTRYTQCDTWRRNVLTKIRSFARVDLLVMSGSSSSTLIRRSDGAVIGDAAAAAAEWGAGYKRVVDRLAGQVRRIVILRDTPALGFAVPSCLVAHTGWTRPCSRLRSAAYTVARWNAEQAVDVQYTWVRASDMGDWICQPTRCWPVTSSRILRYRDSHHLTNTFAAVLAPAMYSRLRWLMR
jgi:SGNH domain (fused to AT3 domains)